MDNSDDPPSGDDGGNQPAVTAETPNAATPDPAMSDPAAPNPTSPDAPPPDPPPTGSDQADRQPAAAETPASQPAEAGGGSEAPATPAAEGDASPASVDEADPAQAGAATAQRPGAADTPNAAAPDTAAPTPPEAGSDQADQPPFAAETADSQQAEATGDTSGTEAPATQAAEGNASLASAGGVDPGQAAAAADRPPEAAETPDPAASNPAAPTPPDAGSDQTDQQPAAAEAGDTGGAEAAATRAEGDASPAPAYTGSSGVTEEQHNWVSNFLGLDPTAARALLGPIATEAAPYVIPAVIAAAMGPAGIAVAAGAAVFFYSRDAGGAWDGATNPETGKPYTSQEEYDRVRAGKGNPNKGKPKDTGAGDPRRDPLEEDDPATPDPKPDAGPPKKRTCADVSSESGGTIEPCGKYTWDSLKALKADPYNKDWQTEPLTARGQAKHVTYYDPRGNEVGSAREIWCCIETPAGPTSVPRWVFNRGPGSGGG